MSDNILYNYINKLDDEIDFLTEKNLAPNSVMAGVLLGLQEARQYLKECVNEANKEDEAEKEQA